MHQIRFIRSAGVVAASVALAASVAAPALAARTAAGHAGRCTTSMLALRHSRAGYGAGQGYERLLFTNVSSHACVLGGFPGVSYVNRRGRQVGASADREGSSFGPVSLAPGDRAHARLHFVNNISAIRGCEHRSEQVRVAGLRVYPPGSTTAMFVRDRHLGCRSAHAHVLDVRAVRG